jgi:hypothetical protein
MPSITLTLPIAGQEVQAGPLATNFASLQALLNGQLDASNLSSTTLVNRLNVGAGNYLTAEWVGNELRIFISGIHVITIPRNVF